MSRSVIAAAVTGLVVMTGCGSPSQPSAPPTSEDALTTATSTPDVVEETTEAEVTSEAPEETSEPAASEMDQTEEGAEAFVEHYMSLLNDGYTTGDPTKVRQASTPNCQSCEELALDAEDAPAGEPLFDLEIDQSVLLGRTARVEAQISEGGNLTDAVFDLAWDGGTWKVDAILIGQP